MLTFILSASPNEITMFVNHLQFDFYGEGYQSKRIVQALKLFKHHPERITAFIKAIKSPDIRDVSSFVIYSTRILVDYSPIHLKLIGEVKWD